MTQFENAKITPRIGARIARAREDRQMTQTELADRIEASLTQVMKYERGEQDMALSRLFDIATVLGISASELMEE